MRVILSQQLSRSELHQNSEITASSIIGARQVVESDCSKNTEDVTRGEVEGEPGCQNLTQQHKPTSASLDRDGKDQSENSDALKHTRSRPEAAQNPWPQTS